MMFLTNIGLLNNTATTHSELVNAIENAGFEMLPPSLFEKTVGEIRERKGLKPEVPGEANYTD